jgi:hypothetical protein
MEKGRRSVFAEMHVHPVFLNLLMVIKRKNGSGILY